MNLLLDTCAVLDLAAGSLPTSAADALHTAGEAIVCPVVPWELAIKVKHGKLQLGQPALDYVSAVALRHGLDLAPTGLDSALLCAAADLPLLHRDPFDRILVALARRRNLVILTRDRMIPTYPGIQSIW